MNWDDILTAKDASLALGKHDKYIYFLWKMHSELVRRETICMKGNTLLISREGFEHLKAEMALKEENRKSNKDDIDSMPSEKMMQQQALFI